MIVLASDYVGFHLLKNLLDSGHDVMAVVTDSSDRGGFNERIIGLASTRGGDIQTYRPEDLGRQDVVASLQARRPKLGILAWWPSLLRGGIRAVPSMGWINLHPSLLPYNRGRNPNFWSIADNTPAGVSLHFIDDGVDTGPLIAQAQIELDWEDTGESAYMKSRERILELFRESIDLILSGQVQLIPQDPTAGTSHTFNDMVAESMIDLDTPTTARNVLNVIRAKMFRPHEPARFRDGDRTYSVEVTIKDVSDDV